MLTVTNGAKHDWGSMPLDEMAIGCAMDCDFTLRVWRILRKEMRAKSLNHVYDNLLKEIALELAEVENFGITVFSRKNYKSYRLLMMLILIQTLICKTYYLQVTRV